MSVCLLLFQVLMAEPIFMAFSEEVAYTIRKAIGFILISEACICVKNFQ